jgi:hypothetical protein
MESGAPAVALDGNSPETRRLMALLLQHAEALGMVRSALLEVAQMVRQDRLPETIIDRVETVYRETSEVIRV